MTQESPNVWSFLIAGVQMLGTAFAVWLAYRKTRQGQDPKLDKIEPKLDKIETLVNGDRAAKEARITVLTEQVRALGGTP